jgi:spore coat protein CotH
MITVNNIDGAPESTPETYYAVHNNENFFYFFDTEEEHETYLSTLPVIEQQPEPNPIIEFLKTATEEEKNEFKALLGI